MVQYVFGTASLRQIKVQNIALLNHNVYFNIDACLADRFHCLEKEKRSFAIQNYVFYLYCSL